jgi:hypothetical protein
MNSNEVKYPLNIRISPLPYCHGKGGKGLDIGNNDRMRIAFVYGPQCLQRLKTDQDIGLAL